MIERGGPLSLSRQCGLLGVSRSSQHYAAKGEGAECQLSLTFSQIFCNFFSLDVCRIHTQS